jgi:hypothetical protein
MPAKQKDPRICLYTLGKLGVGLVGTLMFFPSSTVHGGPAANVCIYLLKQQTPAQVAPRKLEQKRASPCPFTGGVGVCIF